MRSRLGQYQRDLLDWLDLTGVESLALDCLNRNQRRSITSLVRQGYLIHDPDDALTVIRTEKVCGL